MAATEDPIHFTRAMGFSPSNWGLLLGLPYRYICSNPQKIDRYRIIIPGWSFDDVINSNSARYLFSASSGGCYTIELVL